MSKDDDLRDALIEAFMKDQEGHSGWEERAAHPEHLADIAMSVIKPTPSSASRVR